MIGFSIKNFLRENHDHLLFVSYPCGFAKFANRRIDDWPEKLESGHLVQCFNIVLLDLGFVFCFCFAGGKETQECFSVQFGV